jgi:hypothetical protein
MLWIHVRGVPKSSRILKASYKPLVVLLLAAKRRKIYHLWTSLSSGIKLGARVHFYEHYISIVLVLFYSSLNVLNWWIWRGNELP